MCGGAGLRGYVEFNKYTHRGRGRSGSGNGGGGERRIAGWEQGQGWRPVDEHRMGTRTGAGTETRAKVEIGMGTRIGTGKGTRIGSRRVHERRRSGRNRTRVVDVMWETGETWVGEKRGKRRKERVGPVAANPDNLEDNKEAGGGAQGTQGLVGKNCTSRESVSPLSRLIRGFRNKYH